jgi:putative FmdB family regulatory protein
MPIYEYRCRACGKEFEVMQRMDAPAPPCRHCGAAGTRRKISPAGFVLKGTGWYKTDYASEDRRKAEKAERGEVAGAGSGEKKEPAGEGGATETKKEPAAPATPPAPTAGGKRAGRGGTAGK